MPKPLMVLKISYPSYLGTAIGISRVTLFGIVLLPLLLVGNFSWSALVPIYALGLRKSYVLFLTFILVFLYLY